MPLLSPTQAGWFESLEKHVRVVGGSVSVAVYHPDFMGRVRLERGQCTIVGTRAGSAEASCATLRSLGEGGYFEVDRGDDEPITVRANPDVVRLSCSSEHKEELFAALLERQFFKVIDEFCRSCAGCLKRPECAVAAQLQTNLPQLVALTRPGQGHETLTE